MAVIRLDDPSGGAEGYTFDIEWRGGSPFDTPATDTRRGRRRVDPYANLDTARACEDAVRDRARQQFATSDIRFRDRDVNDNPGRNDTVAGNMEVRRGNTWEQYHYTCSVNLNNGRVFGP
jgi:hypothetical protein